MLRFGRYTNFLDTTHAVDWFIPWQTMPLLMTLPASWLFASIVRCACDIGLAYVIKKA